MNEMKFSAMVELKELLEEKRAAMIEPLTDEEEQMLPLLDKLILRELKSEANILPTN